MGDNILNLWTLTRKLLNQFFLTSSIMHQISLFIYLFIYSFILLITSVKAVYYERKNLKVAVRTCGIDI